MKSHTPLMLGLCLLTFVSCGGDDDNKSSAAPEVEQQQNEIDIGRYTFELRPINSIDNNASAIGDINIENDEFRVNLGGTNIRRKESGQMIHIHTGRSCPTLEANDTNGDNILDLVEASAVAGQDLIPLDGDLNGQEEGGTDLPRSNQLNVITYQGSGNLPLMVADLREEDPDPNDLLAKLSPNENLNLDGRAIIIHGVPDDETLPPSVQSPAGTDPRNTLPISCGIIRRFETPTP